MNDLAARILVLVPNVDFDSTCRLVDDADGTGPRIAYWDAAALGPQPTQEQLEAVTQQQIDALPGHVAQADRETLKAGYLSILADLDMIQTGATASIAAVEEIRTRTISNQAQAVQALRDLAAEVKLAVQGIKLHAAASEKTLRGLRLIIGV